MVFLIGLTMRDWPTIVETEDFNMNYSPSGSFVLSKAIPGFINYKTAEGLALRMIDSIDRLLSK
jgi:hypothetical protein